jgi:uncharacterized membrane protein YhaH (DUF805 family)
VSKFRHFVRTTLRPALTGKGRIGRFVFVGTGVVAVFSLFLSQVFMPDYFRAALSLLCLWVFGGAMTSRLHDMNRSLVSVWPILLVFPIGALSPVVWSALGSVFEDLYAEAYAYWEVAAFTMYAYLTVFIGVGCIWLSVKKGTQTENDFGPTSDEWKVIWRDWPFLGV